MPAHRRTPASTYPPHPRTRRARAAGREPVVVTDSTGSHSFTAFPAGWGDGCYPTWVGRTADGGVTGFLTEFFVVPQPGRGPVDG
ncbi:DUF4241 domain-containing protein [Kitasatospora sp. NPDC054939]